MNLFDKSIYVSIGICYNLFVHNVINLLYKDNSFDEKFEKSTNALFIAGIIGIIISKLVQPPNKAFSESILSMGFFVGGVLLILTGVWVNWDNLSDDIKLYFCFIVFGVVLYYSYKYENSKNSQNTNNTGRNFGRK